MSVVCNFFCALNATVTFPYNDRGFGFITLKDPSIADLIVSSEHTIDGRVVDVKKAVPRDMAPAPSR